MPMSKFVSPAEIEIPLISLSLPCRPKRSFFIAIKRQILGFLTLTL